MNTSRESLIFSARAAWRARTDPESVHPLARLFWRIMLVAVMLAAACIIAAAGYFFFDTQSAISAVDTLPLKRNHRLDRDKLDAVLADIAARQEAFTERRIPDATVPDPSI